MKISSTVLFPKKSVEEGRHGQQQPEKPAVWPPAIDSKTNGGFV